MAEPSFTNHPDFRADIVPLCECESHRHTPDATTGVGGVARWREFGWVLALWLLHVVGNFWWLKVDTRPPYSDMAGHAITTLRLASWPWRAWLMEGRIWGELLHVNPYPPFFYVTTLPFVWFVWPTVDAMLAVNVLYMGLLMGATYGIGRLAVSGRAGVLAAFLVSMYPLVYGLSRHYLADVALTAVTAFGVFCLFWSESFRRRWPALILGVTIGVGVLTKWTFIVFLIGPLAIAVYMALRQALRQELREARWARVVNVGLAGVASLVIGLPWFLTNLEPLQAFLDFNRTLAAPQEGEAPIWSAESWIYYARELVNQQMLLPFCVLAVVGLVLLLRRCRVNGYVWMLLAWVVVGYVASTLFINKDTRYTMPYLPALALISALGLEQVRRVRVWRALVAVIVVYALVQYAGLTVGLSARLPQWPARISWTVGVLPVTLYAEGVHIADPARTEDWQIDPILAAVMADAAAREVEHPVQLLVVPSMTSFDAQTFTYARGRDRLPMEVSLVTGILAVDSAAMVERSDYVLTKSGDLGWAFVLQDAATVTAQLLDPDSPLAAQFERVAEFPLPDGSQAILLRHVRQ